MTASIRNLVVVILNVSILSADYRLTLTRHTDNSAFLPTVSTSTTSYNIGIALGFEIDKTFLSRKNQQSINMFRFRHWTKLHHLQIRTHRCSKMLSTSFESKNSKNDDTIGSADNASSLSTLLPVINNIATVPRAAVSVAVRVQCECDTRKYNDGDCYNINISEPFARRNATTLTYYLLIQRGTEPSKGMWSLPGGKIEYLESTFQAAKRELYEETKWCTNNNINNTKDTDMKSRNNKELQWYNETVLTTDAIGDGYHYVIAHYFADYPTIRVPMEVEEMDLLDVATNIRQQFLPNVLASDDAINAQWYTLNEIYDMEMQLATATRGVSRVLQRMELYDRANLLSN